MNLSDALGPDVGNNQSGGPWPTNPSNPTWPGQPAANPTWPGGQPAANPTWPGGQPAANPTWPGGQPAANPTWPGGQPAANPTWPGGQPAANPTWPGGQHGGEGMMQPAAPGGWPNPGPGHGHGGWSNPGPGPGPGPGPTIPAISQHSLVVPHKQTLPNGIYDKLLITITGTIKPNADKITIDFAASSDLAFHFNPRFNESGKKVIVRNSCFSKKWGKEERDLLHFPFVQGQPFEIKILCTNREFKVAVNNSHLLDFKHRLTNLRSINAVNIYNDLNLSRVNMETVP